MTAAVRTEDVANTLLQSGWCVLRRVVAGPELDLLRTEADAQIVALPPEQSGSAFRLDNVAAQPLVNPSFAAMRAHPLLLRIMEAALGDDVFPYGGSMVFKQPHLGPEIPLHRDIPEGVFSPGHRWLASGIYLDDADEGNGCLWLIPCSHVLETTEALVARGLDGPEPVAVPLEAGDVLLHDARLLHGSKASRGGPLRRVLYFSYQSAGWVLEEGLKRSFRPGRHWIAECLRLAEWGREVRAGLGLDTATNGWEWSCPRGWEGDVRAIAEIRPEIGVVPYRFRNDGSEPRT